MVKMKDIGLLDCDDRPSIEENFERLVTDSKFHPTGGKITPDWNASEGEEGYIKNRTHYEENKYTTIAEEQTVSHSASLKSSVDGYYNSRGYLDGNKIVVGNTYVVYVDGVPYEGVAYEGAVSANSKKVCIFSPNGKDYTNAPISITVGTGSGGTTCNARFRDDGKHTVKVELYEHSLKKLDPKFLPEGIGGGGDSIFMVTRVVAINPETGEPNFSCTKTFAETLAAYNNGKYVVLREVIVFGDMQATSYYTSMVSYNEDELIELVFRYNTNDGGMWEIRFRSDDTFVGYNATLINHAEITNQGGFIMCSSTPGSEKRFRIEVDDSGTISATEV